MTPRQPRRLASHPVVGAATAVAARLSVTTQAISSFGVDRAPRSWGKTTFARVMVIPNSRLDSCTATRIDHCRDAAQPRLARNRAHLLGRVRSRLLPHNSQDRMPD